MERITETSPHQKARMAGAIYLLALLTGIVAQGFVSGSLVVDGDAAAGIANFVAPRARRKRSTMEGAGQPEQRTCRSRVPRTLGSMLRARKRL